MYHCMLQFYFTGHSSAWWETARSIPPMEHFTHAFSESREPQARLAGEADVVLANLQGMDPAAALRLLAESKKPGSELVLLAEREQIPELAPWLDAVDDIWTLPVSEEEFRFRFVRRQRACKERRDAWETSQYLEATINSIPSLIWYKTKDGIHEKVNDSFCRTVNKTKEQVQGRGHAYIWDVEQDDPACIESERVVMTERRTCVAEEKVLTGDGERLLTTYKSPLYDLNGAVMGTVGVGIDITQERAYEREIVQKNHTLETLFTTMECGIMCHSVDGQRIISINRAALEILGYESQGEMLADGFQMVAASVVDEDKDRLRSCIRDLDRPGESVSVEYRVRHRDGRILHVMGNIKLMQENGELFYQRFLLDCTAQKQREARERAEAESRHMELIQALSVDYSLVCFFDLDTGAGYTLRVADGGRRQLSDIFGGSISLASSMERYIEDYVYPEDQELLRQAIAPEWIAKELMEKGRCYANYRTDFGGKLEYFQMKVVQAGTWSGYRGIVLGLRSVDEETRSEMEKKSLLEDALFQANRASKAKSVFLSNMSHDIRTPMNAIVGFTALAITHIEQTEQVQEYLKKIMTSGNHLLSLINDILDMSRIESGKMHLEEAPCSLPDVLHSLRSIIQADVHAKQLELYIDAVDVVDEEICCDRLRLNQLLLNLLSNAVKYTPAGGIVSIRIVQKPGAPAGFANYEFHIRDTGIGMSKEFTEHIFEPFERERNTTISGIQGTGLGMAITKNIVDMMNGTISVKSEQGSGTEFTVALTFRLTGGEREPQTIPELAGCRALVVDDDFNTCDSVTYMLQQIGLRAEWTLSGKEAVLRTRQAIMRGDNYYVYIVDWLLPDLNGVEVTRRIRKEMGEDVPIIVLTAYDWSDIEEEARAAGVTAFCSKPLFLSELRRCLRSVVNAEEAEEKPAAQEPVRRHTGRILLAEDNELNREIAEAILGEAGFTLEEAENGQIAVDMMARSEPGYYRLVLMDIQMPVMDGYAAAKAIRALENKKLASVPILAMTANAFEEDKQAALRCGMNGHIAKPIDIEKLLETLDEILD
ncbi:MAG: response regulator [Oscillospiraceae bacterium]|nr:response regulator [Oscillospiraceae bacterium]